MKSFARKKHTSWKELPSFFDVSGSVSVATFGARRLPEIKALWSQVEQQDTQLPSISAKALESGGGKKVLEAFAATNNKRRIRHRFPTAEKPPSESQCRKARRRRLHMLESQSTQQDGLMNEPPHRIHWIANHVWHAKRFHMSSLWGWRVPMLHTNRGSKAALRLAQERTLIQEASWCHCPILCTCSDTSLLVRFIQRVIPSFSMSSFGELRVGKGIAYKMDSFPMHALGPVTWIVTGKEGFLEAVDSPSVVLLVHPSILLSVLKELNAVEGLDARMYTERKLCCLRLRGFQPDICLAKSVSTHFSLEAQKQLDAFVKDTSASHSDAIKLKGSDERRADVIIVREVPRDITLSPNLGVVGFDIYCFAATAKSLFQSLILFGGAAPISLTEEAHLCQEVHPPIPLFPRDWPDTPSGIEYWQGNGAWSDVRRYLEGGSGRIDRLGPPLGSVQWSELLERKDNVESNVVVVRGIDFGKPFQDALVASGSSYSFDGTDTQKPIRHPRRSSSPAYVLVPKLSVEFARTFHESCNALIESLSLPALLQCHITVFGKGVIKPNDKVFSGQGELGVVTAGAFSLTRGHFHGLAIIGASRFLSHIAASVSSGSGTFAVRGCDGKRSVQHGVSIRCGDQSVFGTLALIL